MTKMLLAVSTPTFGTEASHTLAEALRRALREAIVRGRLGPGAPLRTQQLREEYGCSLAPLREALSALAADGLVTESQRGFRVATISRAEWQDIIACRLEIEPRALALSIKHGLDDWEGHIARCARQYTLASRRVLQHTAEIDEAWEISHRALHLSLLVGCHSPWLLRFCRSLYDHSDRYRRLARPATEVMSNLDTGESELVIAALARDGRRADQLLREHIREIGREVLAHATLWEGACQGIGRTRLTKRRFAS